jgi:hypothetical protein
MKKTFLTLIVATLLSLSLLAQKRTGPDSKFFGLKGPVKTVRLEITDIRSRDGKSVEDRRRLISLATYDEKGNMVEEVRYNQDGSVEEKEVFIHDGFQRQKATAYKGDGTVISNTVYSYDAEGKLITWSSYKEDGALLLKGTHMYRPDGKPLEGTIYNANGSVMSKTIFKYDSNGKPVEDAVYNSAGVMFQKNVHGKEDASILYNEDGSIGYQFVNKARTWEYDPQGNWIKQLTPSVVTRRDTKEEIVSVMYRTITYY